MEGTWDFFPRKVRGTADPSTSLGMTKERATLFGKWFLNRRRFSSPWVGRRPVTLPVEMTNSVREHQASFPSYIVISTGA
jgi:hypothetical protein